MYNKHRIKYVALKPVHSSLNLRRRTAVRVSLETAGSPSVDKERSCNNILSGNIMCSSYPEEHIFYSVIYASPFYSK